jgi:uncharacterized membrane-anchored protein YhcB (DUF1043 family)
MTKSKLMTAAKVAGAVVGAGAVIAGAVAMSKKKNQRKVKATIAKTKKMVEGYSQQVQAKVDEKRGELKKAATSAIAASEMVTKIAKKGVKKI